MNKKTLYLIGSILGALVFIGYCTEPGPREIFGLEINIWIVRAAWLLIAVSNFLNYMKLRKAEESIK